MPITVTHSILGLIAAKVTTAKKVSPRFLVLSAVCPALPDIDVWFRKVGLPYDHFFGHRGFFHSLFFALLVSGLVVWLFFARTHRARGHRLFLTVYFFLITASHPFLDMFTDGGSGVALLSPFSTQRFRADWRPIQAAPFGLTFNEVKLQALGDEFVWLLFPALLIWLIVWVSRNILTDEDKD